jgi:hypothetical protein
MIATSTDLLLLINLTVFALCEPFLLEPLVLHLDLQSGKVQGLVKSLELLDKNKASG